MRGRGRRPDTPAEGRRRRPHHRTRPPAGGRRAPTPRSCRGRGCTRRRCTPASRPSRRCPDVRCSPRTTRPLPWARPRLVVAGRRSLAADLVVLVHVVPAVVPALLPGVLLRALAAAAPPRGTWWRTTCCRTSRTPVTRSWSGRAAARGRRARALRRAGRAGPRARRAAASRSPSCPRTCRAAAAPPRRPHDGPRPAAVLRLGIVREYKGVDLLLQALQRSPVRG